MITRGWIATAGVVALLACLVLFLPERPARRGAAGDADAERAGSGRGPAPLPAPSPDGRVPAAATLHGAALPRQAVEPPTPRRAVLEGEVLDGATRRGIEGALVISLCGKEDVGVHVARTDAKGHFVLRSLAPGRWWLFVWHPAYLSPGLDALLQKDGHRKRSPQEIVTVPTKGGSLSPVTLTLTRGRRIEGRVLDAAGRPVAGATIRLREGAWRHTLERRLHISLEGWERYLPLRSDEEGRFSLACLPPSFGSIQLGTYGAGFVSRWSEEIPLDANAAPVEVVIHTLDTATIEGHVRLADGRPALGTSLTPSRPREEDWACRAPKGVDVDAEGTYEISGLVPDSLTLTGVWASPYAYGASLFVKTLSPGEVRTGVDLTMPVRYVLRGTLQDASGKPLPGEMLVVRASAAGAREGVGGDRYATTQDDGTFDLSLPRPGPWLVSQFRGEGPERLLRDHLMLPIDPVTLVTTPTPRTRIEVHVHDEAGRPVAQFFAMVTSAQAEEGTWDNPCRTDTLGEQGRAVLEVAGTAPFKVHVSDARGEDGETTGLGEATVELNTLPEGGVADVILRLRDQLRGRVVGPDGRPVPGVTVTLVVDPYGDSPRQVSVPVDGAGAYVCRVGADADESLLVEIHAPQGWATVTGFTPDLGGPGRITRLVPGGEVAGRVVTPSGPPSLRPEAPLTVHVSWEGPGGAGQGASGVDAEGQWRVEGVPIGRELSVGIFPQLAREAGYAPPETVEGVHAGDTDVVVRLVPGLTISGRVVESDGTPPRLEGILLLGWSLNAPKAPAAACRVSPEDGRFDMKGLAPGRYHLRLLSATAHLDEGDFAAGAGDIVIRLPRRGSLTLEVEGEIPTGGLWAAVRIAGSTSACRIYGVGAEGTAEIDDLPMGETFDVTVGDYASDGLLAAASGVHVGDVVHISLIDGFRVAGTLRSREGGQVDMSRIGALCAIRQGACFELDLDSSGTFQGWVTPGRYEIRLVAPDGTSTTLARDVEAGREDLDLAFPPR